MNDLATAIAEILEAEDISEGVCVTAVPGLRLVRTARNVPPRHMAYRASLCFIAQGEKDVFAGDTTIAYGPMQSLLVTVDLPVVSTIRSGGAGLPFIGGTLDLDMAVLVSVATRLEARDRPDETAKFGLLVGELDRYVGAAVLRLVELVKRPEAIEILYPGIMQELCYWLLRGPQGATIAKMVLPTGQTMRIAKAIRRLCEDYRKPLGIPGLAAIAGMSVSSFHQHFRTVTSMSPLQYQKNLRLLEARRLMFADGAKAGVAAFAVGYESVSQFSREYSRMFGCPPGRDAQRARTAAVGPQGSAPQSPRAGRRGPTLGARRRSFPVQPIVAPRRLDQGPQEAASRSSEVP